MGQIFITNLAFGGFTPVELYNNSTPGFVNVYGVIPLYTFELLYDYGEDDFEIVENRLPETETKLSDDDKLIDDYSNIIVIQVESLDKKTMDYEYNDKEIVPL